MTGRTVIELEHQKSLELVHPDGTRTKLLSCKAINATPDRVILSLWADEGAILRIAIPDTDGELLRSLAIREEAARKAERATAAADVELEAARERIAYLEADLAHARKETDAARAEVDARGARIAELEAVEPSPATVDRVLEAVCLLHDGGELWGDTRRNADAFRAAVRTAIIGRPTS